MKKMILMGVALLGMAFGASAQQKDCCKVNDNCCLPKAGDVSLEVQFNPFSNNFQTFKIDQLQGRYFLGDKDAVRFGLGFGVHTDKETPAPDSQSDEWTKNRKGNFSINLGYERHFFNFKRVDLYAGAGLGFGLQSTCQTVSDSYQVNGATQYYEVRKYNQDSWTRFNVNAFTGIDFYVYKGLYLGAELALEVGFKHFPGQYTKGALVNGTYDKNWKSDKTNKSTTFDLGLLARPSLRLGWTF